MDTINNDYSDIVNIEKQIIQDLMISRYFTAAVLVVVMYDAILTIEDEVRLVWQGAFAVPKLLYYINRYCTIATLIVANYLVAGFRPPLSTTFCRNWVFASAITQLIADMASSAILVLRVAALYNNTKWVGRGLWILSGLPYIIVIVMSVISIKAIHKKFVYEPLSRGCIPVNDSYTPHPIIAAPIVFDIAIIILTAFKTSRLAAALRGQPSAEILHTMFRDGFMYFIIIVAIRISTTIMWVTLPKSFIYLGVYSYWAMLSTMTSRLFLNLRSAGSGAPNHLQDQSVTTPHLGNRQAMPPESVQLTSRPTLTAANLDTTLFSMASGVERSTFSDQGRTFSWDAVETRTSGDDSAGDVELQLRDR